MRHPGNPANPVRPGNPAKPVNPWNPVHPMKPVNPKDPTKPAPKVPTIKVVRCVTQKPPTCMTKPVSPTKSKKPSSSKSRKSAKTILLILLIIAIILFLSGLLTYLSSRPRRIIIKLTSRGGHTRIADSTTSNPADVVMDLTKPVVQPVGQDKYEGELQGEVIAWSYEITMNLSGGAPLGPTTTLTGRVDAHLHVLNDTEVVVFMADSKAVQDIRVAMLCGSVECLNQKGIPVLSVSRDKDFLIVRPKEPLLANLSYTLVTTYRYEMLNEGPITVTNGLARMELKPGHVHKAFPCYEEKGLLVPVALIISAPGDCKVVSNEVPTCNLTKHRRTKHGLLKYTKGQARVHNFTNTMPMPLHKLAWAVLPGTMKAYDIVPGLLTLIAEKDDVELKNTAKKSFKLLEWYFQAARNRYIPKLDFVLGTAVQDSIGFLLLTPRVTPKGIGLCKKIAEQWTKHVLPQYSTQSWLASSGVDYLCRLALADGDSGVMAAFQSDIDKCITNSATEDIKKVLAFRTAHITLGDRAMSVAILKYVQNNLFKDTAPNDDTLEIFAPELPQEKLQSFLSVASETVKLERTFGAQNKLKLKEPKKQKPIPVAINAVTSAGSLIEPDGFNMTWLSAETPEIELALTDSDSLFVNPLMAAFYGIELDKKSWALIGHEMYNSTPNVLNAQYLLNQASRQYANVTWPHDIAGLLWACVALKNGDKRLWEQFGKVFVTSEHHAYTMLVLTSELDKAYKTRVEDIIKNRVQAIKAATELRSPAKQMSTAVILANVACFIGSANCPNFTAGLENLIIDKNFKTSAQQRTLLAPEAVACMLASAISNDASFDAKVKDGALSMRLAFGACVREGVADARLKTLALDALTKDLDSEGTTGVRLSADLRNKILAYLTFNESSTISASPDALGAAIVRAVKLRALRSVAEAQEVKKLATGDPHKVAPDSPAVKALDSIASDEYEPLVQWVNLEP